MIDGIFSGRFLLKPKAMFSKRGTRYAIAKMQVFSYSHDNLKSKPLDADIIAFDVDVVRELLDMKAGEVCSIAGIITPMVEQDIGQEMPITLKMTAMALVRGYEYGQSQGKGELFQMIKRM